MSYFTAEQEQQKMFTQLPKALLYEDAYKPMSNDSKVLYSFLVDRVSLSLKNGYIDELGRVYIKCSEITMAEILNKSEKTVRKFKKELIDKGLLEQPDEKNNKTMYYVKQPTVTVDKLDDYIVDFQAVVKDKAKKEIERNREYRLKQAQNKLAVLKAKECNGNNDRSVENTSFDEDETLEPLETLATVKTTVVQRSKLPYSNNEFSNTELKDSMYVCTGEPANRNSMFIQLGLEHQIAFSSDMKDILVCYEDVFEYELYEYMFFEVLNKYRNGKASNFERYLLSVLDGASSRKTFTLPEYTAYKADFNAKNYNRPNTKNIAPKKTKTPEVKPDFKPAFVEPIAEPVVEPIVVPEVKPKKEYDADERLACFKFRQANGLMDVRYSQYTLEELKEVVLNNK